jgi:O-antigen/teichoic acid export membrane protein
MRPGHVAPALRVIRNSSLLMAGEIYGVSVNLVTVAILSRYLPLEVFGDYGFILAVSMTFMVLTDMGAGPIAIREIARDLHRAEKVFAATVILRCLLSAVTFLAIVGMVRMTSDSPAVLEAAFISAIGVVVFFLGDVPQIVFMAHERMQFNAIVKVAAETVYLAGIATVAFLDFGLSGVFLASLASYAARLAIGLLILKRSFFSPRLTWDPALLRWLFLEALPIGANRLLRKVSFRIDTILLQVLRTREEVGIFHGIYRLVLVVLFVPRMITDALFPLFARYSEGSSVAMAVSFEKSMKFLLILVLPLMLVVFVGADEIVALLLGKNFASSCRLLQLFSLVWGVSFFSVLCNKVLNASNHQRLATIATACCVAVNLALDLALIPSFGYTGAAVATLCAETVLLVVGFRFVSTRICRVTVVSVLWKPAFAGASAALVAAVFSSSAPWMRASVALATYSSLLLALGVFDRSELDVLRALGLQLRRRFHPARRRAALGSTVGAYRSLRKDHSKP